MQIPRLSLGTALLLGTAALPIAGCGTDTPRSTDTQAPLVQPDKSLYPLTDKDRTTFEELMRRNKGDDLRLKEINYAKEAYPIIRQRLLNLYTAEAKDNLEGKFTNDKRAVKIAISDRVSFGGEGEDMGLGGYVHAIKYFDEKIDEKTTLRIYVNEHWAINKETNKLLPPESIRIRAQVFEGDLKKYGAEEDFLPDMIHLAWGKINNTGNKKLDLKPFLYRQNLYKQLEPGKKANEMVSNEQFLSSPIDCMHCHRSSSKDTQLMFGVKKTNFGAITPDEEFKKDFKDQRGYKLIEEALRKAIKEGTLNEKDANLILLALQDPQNFELPNIVNALKESGSVPWIGEDLKLGKDEIPPEGYFYEFDNARWRKAGYTHFEKLGLLKGLGKDWNRNSLEIIP